MTPLHPDPQLERGREREDSAASSDVQEDSSSAKPWSFGSAQDSKAWVRGSRVLARGTHRGSGRPCFWGARMENLVAVDGKGRGTSLQRL